MFQNESCKESTNKANERKRMTFILAVIVGVHSFIFLWFVHFCPTRFVFILLSSHFAFSFSLALALVSAKYLTEAYKKFFECTLNWWLRSGLTFEIVEHIKHSYLERSKYTLFLNLCMCECAFSLKCTLWDRKYNANSFEKNLIIKLMYLGKKNA